MMMSKLVDYIIAAAPPLVPIHATLYEYVMACDGVYLRAAKPDLEVCFRIARCQIKGLQRVNEIFEWQLPRVPAVFLECILVKARQAALGDLEMLFHLHHSSEWFLDVPEQEQAGASCRSLDDASTNRAQIELHSHHSMPAFFSGPASAPNTDDHDEQGFRIYVVMGRVLEAPELRVRVGVYSHFWQIPAEWVFEMPEGVRDCNGD
jgi:PRTRC genetic system protein A